MIYSWYFLIYWDILTSTLVFSRSLSRWYFLPHESSQLDARRTRFRCEVPRRSCALWPRCPIQTAHWCPISGMLVDSSLPRMPESRVHVSKPSTCKSWLQNSQELPILLHYLWLQFLSRTLDSPCFKENIYMLWKVSSTSGSCIPCAFHVHLVLVIAPREKGIAVAQNREHLAKTTAFGHHITSTRLVEIGLAHVNVWEVHLAWELQQMLNV